MKEGWGWEATGQGVMGSGGTYRNIGVDSDTSAGVTGGQGNEGQRKRMKE